MITYIFAALVALHGLIHLMGFVKAFALADLPALTRAIPKMTGLAWLASALIICAAAAALLLGVGWWWMVAVTGLLASQTLIVRYWHDAKFGSIANVILLAGAVVGYGAWSFSSMVTTELEAFLPADDGAPVIVTRQMTAAYPPVVRRWFERSRIVGKPVPRTVHLHQEGMMRSSREGAWMPVKATQWFTTGEPGFFWTAKVKAAAGMSIVARDKYEGGRGSMLIKAVSVFPIADAHGPEVDQGSMLRYLAELAWFPAAAMGDYLHWEEIDSMTARATMTYGGITGTGVFRFDEQGNMLSFEAKRYYDRKGGATLEDWLIQIDPDGYREFEGVRIPAKASVTWKLKDGDLTWLTLEITALEYD